MIETEQQRRWWFATHPEYSHHSTGQRSKSRYDGDEESDKISPEAVDAWADDRLKRERDPVGIELLKQAKFWFGTEFDSKPAAERYAMLWSDDDSVASDALFKDKSEDESSERQPTDHPAADRGTYDKYEDVMDRIDQYGKAQEHGFRENWDLFWWRARNKGWTEEQARTVWNQIDLEKATNAPLHDPWVELGLALTGAVGALSALRHALIERAAAQAVGNSRLAILWHKVANYLTGPAAARVEKTGTALSEQASVEATISRTKYPQSAGHAEDAQAAGHPSEVTIERTGADRRGLNAVRGHSPVPGKDLDEYPPKMFLEGGKGASIRPISPSDNRGSGASIGNQLRKYPNGTKVKIKVVE